MVPRPASGAAPEASGAAGMRRSTVFGVVGGIAAGKSLVSTALAGPDGVVLSADAVAHAVLRSPAVTERVRGRFGPGVIGADGTPDRAALARIVFGDDGARKLLEGWIHGEVRARLRAELGRAIRDGVPRIVLDVPLLLENAGDHGLLDLCDHVVFVDAPLEERDQRAVRDRGWEPGEVARREAAQMSLAEKRARADIVIDNDSDPKTLVERVRHHLDALAD